VYIFLDIKSTSNYFEKLKLAGIHTVTLLDSHQLAPYPLSAQCSHKALAGGPLWKMGAPYFRNALFRGLTPEGPPCPGLYAGASPRHRPGWVGRPLSRRVDALVLLRASHPIMPSASGLLLYKMP
jgi:hypothetical protein